MENNVTTHQNNSVHGDDSLLTVKVDNDTFIDAVMDGVTDHGGAEASNAVKERIQSDKPTTTEEIENLLSDLNTEFYQVGGGRFLLTTASIIITTAAHIYVVAVGDSPIYLLQNGEFSQLSGRIGGLLRLTASSAVGAQSSLTFQTHDCPISSGDKLLIVSDGISDNLELNEIQEFMTTIQTTDELVQTLETTSAERTQRGGTPTSMRGRVRNDDRSIIARFF